MSRCHDVPLLAMGRIHAIKLLFVCLFVPVKRYGHVESLNTFYGTFIPN